MINEKKGRYELSESNWPSFARTAGLCRLQASTSSTARHAVCDAMGHLMHNDVVFERSIAVRRKRRKEVSVIDARKKPKLTVVAAKCTFCIGRIDHWKLISNSLDRTSTLRTLEELRSWHCSFPTNPACSWGPYAGLRGSVGNNVVASTRMKNVSIQIKDNKARCTNWVSYASQKDKQSNPGGQQGFSGRSWLEGRCTG